MFIRTQENYRKVLKTIVRLKKEYWIKLSTLFNILVGTYLEREMYGVPENGKPGVVMFSVL